MPTREHAILHKKVINLDHGGAKHVMCAWDDCEKDGYELFKVRVNYGTDVQPQIVNHVFCSERHLQYWVNSTKAYGKLPPGYRLSRL